MQAATTYNPGRLRAAVDKARIYAARAERKLGDRFSDAEARQLRSLRRAYSGEHGPEVLIFGDSAMFWTAPGEDDPRRLYDMIRDDLGPGSATKVLYGPGYHARIVMAFLASLDRCKSRPRLVIVPLSIMMTTIAWHRHPEFSYETVSADLLRAAADGTQPRRLTRTPIEMADAYDREISPSLFGENHTYGELRMLIHGRAETPWQKAVRLRHRIDYYNAERLEPESPGVQFVADLARTLVHMDLRAVSYIIPVDRDDLAEAGGQAFLDHAARNAEVIATTFQENMGARGAMVNAVLDSPGTDFIDPLHLAAAGRRRLAARIVAAARPFLAEGCQ